MFCQAMTSFQNHSLNAERLPIVPKSGPNCLNAAVQATPAVGTLSQKPSLNHKASFLLFIKNKQK